MSKYLIKDESLVELADILRDKYFYYDRSLMMMNHNKINDEMVIPEGTTHIGSHAFDTALNFRNIIIPNSVISIGSYAFYGSPYQQTNIIQLSNNLLTIDRCAFSYNGGLKEITIPNSVTYVGEYAFSHCTNLSSIALPDSDNIVCVCHEAFNDTAYYNNEENWENNILYIGSYLIQARTDISECEIKVGTKTICANAFSSCSNLTTVNIPEGVIDINDWAFTNCRNLANITIPSTIRSLGISLFGLCESVTDIYMKAAIPPSLSNSLAVSTVKTSIHVPIGSGDVYKSATNWSRYANKIVEDIEIG